MRPFYLIKLRRLFELVCRSWGLDFWSVRRLENRHIHQMHGVAIDRIERLARCMYLFGLPLELTFLRRLAIELNNDPRTGVKILPSIFTNNPLLLTEEE